MKQKIYIVFFLFGMFLLPHINYAQVDFNKTPDDDLGNNEDEFQELFYKALKNKSVENFDRAADGFQKAIALDSSVPVLYFELGKCFNKLKNFGMAEEAFKEAVNKDPDNEWFLDELYGFYMAKKDYDKAIKTIKQLVKFHPDYKEDLASLYFKTKKYDEALSILDTLDKDLGVSISRDVIRNRIYKASGRKKDQIQNLKARVANNPNKESNYLALIFRYSDNNEKDKAFKTAKELLKVNPNSKLVHLALYKFYLNNDETEKAVESMKIVLKSIEVKPEAKVKVLRDFVSFVKENPEFETDLIEATALVHDKDNSKSVEELGQYYLSKNDKAKALENFEAALKLEPNNFGVLRNVMLLYLDLKKYNLAYVKSKDVLELYPAQPIVYLINGVALNELSKPKDALETLETGLENIIDDTKMEVDFYIQISKAYTLLNNTVKANTFTKKAKQLQNKK